MSTGRLLLVWAGGSVAALVSGVLLSLGVALLALSGAMDGPYQLVVVQVVQVTAGILAGAVGVAVAVLLWAARTELAGRARWWTWLVVGLPVVLVTAAVDALVVARYGVTPGPGAGALLALELALTGVLAVLLGGWRARRVLSLDSTA
ncbi:hypothetical protein J4G33_10690 [Actinotalea sp. BY-33]|uniref:Uncharacterized protein n=1 Tax=Actinotalea soli TaxID=2819234 RepID=A0A939LR29_9CELL|nr:hypothetical protein [Actinotalea soli]MBO1752268.1 hypothetical protein [Actinotalea soli]